MSNDISTSIIPPALSFLDCLTSGEVNPMRYITYRRRLDRLLDITHNYYDKKRKYSSLSDKYSPTPKRTRSVKRHKLLVRDKDGELREILPIDTLWYVMYVANPPRNKRLHK